MGKRRRLAEGDTWGGVAIGEDGSWMDGTRGEVGGFLFLFFVFVLYLGSYAGDASRSQLMASPGPPD